VALGRGHQRDRRQVGGERRPGPVVDLGHLTERVLADEVLAGPVDEQIAPFRLALDAEPAEAQQRRVEVLDRRVLDRDVAPRDGGQPDERARLDVVGSDREVRAPELVDALDGQHVGSDARDPRAHRVQQAAEVLHVRLRGRVAQLGRPRARTAAMMAFSVPVTDGSSRKTSYPGAAWP
jgi:hypothetical protein